MTTRPFKSISAQELEAAIATAITTITGTETTVSVKQWRESDFEPIASIGRDKYELELSLTVGKSYGRSSVPPGLASDLGMNDDDFKL